MSTGEGPVEFSASAGPTLGIEVELGLVDRTTLRLVPASEQVLALLDGVRHEDYYVGMAVAWAVSVCYVKFPALTLEYLRNSSLSDFTYNRALQKIIESLRVSREDKSLMRSMKRK